MDNSQKKPYKYLPFIVSIYSLCFLLPSILLRKLIDFPYMGVIPISILLTGTYFMLLDIITEVYGYYEARKTLFAGLITYTFFVFTMEMIVSLPSSSIHSSTTAASQGSLAYDHIFKGLYLVWFSVVICSLFANTLNIFVLSKWKILTKGKYFWMRSVTSSLITAILYSTLSNAFAFGLSMKEVHMAYFLKLTIISISAKLLTLVLCAYPAAFLCKVLKRAEGLDVYDYDINFFQGFKSGLKTQYD